MGGNFPAVTAAVSDGVSAGTGAAAQTGPASETPSAIAVAARANDLRSTAFFPDKSVICPVRIIFFRST